MENGINQIPIKIQEWEDIILTAEERTHVYNINKLTPTGAWYLELEYKDKKFFWDLKYTFGLL